MEGEGAGGARGGGVGDGGIIAAHCLIHQERASSACSNESQAAPYGKRRGVWETQKISGYTYMKKKMKKKKKKMVSASLKLFGWLERRLRLWQSPIDAAVCPLPSGHYASPPPSFPSPPLPFSFFLWRLSVLLPHRKCLGSTRGAMAAPWLATKTLLYCHKSTVYTIICIMCFTVTIIFYGGIRSTRGKPAANLLVFNGFAFLPMIPVCLPACLSVRLSVCAPIALNYSRLFLSHLGCFYHTLDSSLLMCEYGEENQTSR